MHRYLCQSTCPGNRWRNPVRVCARRSLWLTAVEESGRFIIFWIGSGTGNLRDAGFPGSGTGNPRDAGTRAAAIPGMRGRIGPGSGAVPRCPSRAPRWPRGALQGVTARASGRAGNAGGTRKRAFDKPEQRDLPEGFDKQNSQGRMRRQLCACLVENLRCVEGWNILHIRRKMHNLHCPRQMRIEASVPKRIREFQSFCSWSFRLVEDILLVQLQ